MSDTFTHNRQSQIIKSVTNAKCTISQHSHSCFQRVIERKIEGRMEVAVKRGSRLKQPLDDLKEKRRW